LCFTDLGISSKVPLMRHPNFYIIAGPNGSGKTTFADRFLPIYTDCKNFVNADNIAKGLSPYSPRSFALKAGRLLLEQTRIYAAKNADFAIETTLSGKNYISFLKELRSKGYKIHLFFLWIPSVDLSLARIKDRVLRGGHDVPEPDVRRRFNRGISNFFKLYEPLLDWWTLFDNSTAKPHLIAKREDGTLTIESQELYSKIKKAAGV
jgi:predicted ABC-type ATPase